jgi:hypothetical protein
MDILKQELLKERASLEKRIAAINVLLNTATEADLQRLISSIEEQDNVKISLEEKIINVKKAIESTKIYPHKEVEKIEQPIIISEPIKEVIKNQELSSEDEIQRAKEDIKFRNMWA